jgi:uncharacterized protein YdhG (YjbR/CyaY superfamily)
MNKTQFKNVDAYIEAWPEDVRAKLGAFRRLIRKAAPDAEEVLSYQMPAYKLHGILVYFAAHSTHIGFYPTGGAIEAFASELGDRVTGKGTVRLRPAFATGAASQDRGIPGQ